MAIRQIKLDFETVLNLLSLARRADLNINRQEEKRLHEEERKDRVGL